MEPICGQAIEVKDSYFLVQGDGVGDVVKHLEILFIELAMMWLLSRLVCRIISNEKVPESV
jgi:hypothetical protein